LTDTHSVLLWQTCAFADELIGTAQSPAPASLDLSRDRR
jgi:hypothetical protein